MEGDLQGSQKALIRESGLSEQCSMLAGQKPLISNVEHQMDNPANLRLLRTIRSKDAQSLIRAITGCSDNNELNKDMLRAHIKDVNSPHRTKKTAIDE